MFKIGLNGDGNTAFVKNNKTRMEHSDLTEAATQTKILKTDKYEIKNTTHRHLQPFLAGKF